MLSRFHFGMTLTIYYRILLCCLHRLYFIGDVIPKKLGTRTKIFCSEVDNKTSNSTMRTLDDITC